MRAFVPLLIKDLQLVGLAAHADGILTSLFSTILAAVFGTERYRWLEGCSVQSCLR